MVRKVKREVEVYVLLEKAEPSSAIHKAWNAEKEVKPFSYFPCKCLFFFLFP